MERLKNKSGRKVICYTIEKMYNRYAFLLDENFLNEKEKDYFLKVSADMPDYVAVSAIGTLAEYLHHYCGKKVIILLDEYDTPVQEAYVFGYREKMTEFIRGLFHSTFKTNSSLERGILTGITRISKETIFSDLNNPEVVTTTSDRYQDIFGFTEEEVFTALDEYGLSERRQQVKDWYDVMMEPKGPEDAAVILEFKVHDAQEENNLQDTVEAALKQIEKQKYEAVLTARGILPERIRTYGFVFHGKKVLIGGGRNREK